MPAGLFGAKARAYVEFAANPGTLADPAPELPDPDDLNNPTNRPGRCAGANLQLATC